MLKIMLSIVCMIASSMYAVEMNHDDAASDELAPGSLPYLGWEKLELRSDDMLDMRMLTFLKIAASRAGFPVKDIDAEQAAWGTIKKDIQTDAQKLAAKYCPNGWIERMLLSTVVCDACDLLAKLQGDGLEEAIDFAALNIKRSYANLFEAETRIYLNQLSTEEKAHLAKILTVSEAQMNKSRGAILLVPSGHIAYTMNMPLRAMLNPSMLLSVFEE
jgi:hypothetical protein